jgi:diadenosine tetraphosphate (Ap4A) HIT family hydrolase
LVRLREDLYGEAERRLPFKAGRAYVFLGEIPNMPGHCVVVELRGGRIWSGFHTDNFCEIPPDEV